MRVLLLLHQLFLLTISYLLQFLQLVIKIVHLLAEILFGGLHLHIQILYQLLLILNHFLHLSAPLLKFKSFLFNLILKFLMKPPRSLLVVSFFLVYFSDIGTQTDKLLLHLKEQIWHAAGEDQIALVSFTEHLAQTQLFENRSHQKMVRFGLNFFGDFVNCDKLLVSGYGKWPWRYGLGSLQRWQLNPSMMVPVQYILMRLHHKVVSLLLIILVQLHIDVMVTIRLGRHRWEKKLLLIWVRFHLHLLLMKEIWRNEGII